MSTIVPTLTRIPNSVMTHILVLTIGMFITKHTVTETTESADILPSTATWHIHLTYYDGSMFAYSVRRRGEVNPVRIDGLIV